MLPRSRNTDAFWHAFRRYAGLDRDNYVVGSFGDSPEMATELARLVIAGIKGPRPAWHMTTMRASQHRYRRFRHDVRRVKVVDGSSGEPPRLRSNRCPRSMSRLSGTRGRGTARETGGSMLIAAILLGKRRVIGFEIDDEILTVFERFEVAWPLDVADMIAGPTSAST
jgi:hypothetical protein